ncbi:MAG: formate dehydrogenase accessory protein FdhE [Desulfonauticus sp.]|nr:formate dehydrogenase accessory protein FdhE [Desulfonauticus sp.]
MLAQKIEKKIAEIEDKNIFPPELVNFIKGVSLIQAKYFEIEDLDPLNISKETIEDNFAKGKPILERKNFPLPLDKVKSLLTELLDFILANEQLKDPGRVLANDLEKEDFFYKSVQKFLEQDDAFFRVYGEKLEQSPRLLSCVVQSSIAPFAVSITKQFLSLIPDAEYSFGHCPVCGSLPLISALEDKAGTRKNYCSFCLFAYKVPRLQCVFCGEEYKKDHTYFYAKQLPGYRVDTCDKCKKYIKTIDFRKMDKFILPMLDDFISFPLDVKARKEGYLRPTLSFWGF